jgi:hypothetical protein
MLSKIKSRIVGAIVSITIALLIQYVGTTAGSEYPSWWLILNTVPYLVAFGADVVLGLAPDPVFYLGIAVQWGIIGILITELFIKYRRSSVS